MRQSRRPLLVACSGGPDSVALALGCVETAPQFGIAVRLGHVNHRLRGAASHGDARFVTQLGRKLGLPVAVVNRAIDRATGNLEEKARDKRYAALETLALRVRAVAILTAHTLNDQVETVLMNLIRGAGLDGLAGIRDERTGGVFKTPILRPLLNVSRKEILAFLRRRRQAFRQDDSNRDEHFFRNWLRRRVVPSLENRSRGATERIGRLAEIARAERDHWEKEMERLTARLTRPHRTGVRLDGRQFLGISLAAQRRLLRRIAGFDLLTFEAVENLRRWIAKPPSNARIWQLKRGWIVERLRRSPSNRSSTVFWFHRHGSIGVKRDFRGKKDASKS